MAVSLKPLPATHEHAERRRKALETAGCATYHLTRINTTPVIVCLCCGLWSPLLKDIEQLYCVYCDADHSIWKDDRS